MIKITYYFFKNFLFSNKKEWLRFDSIFMVSGIILSVAILTLSLSLFEGYEKSLKEAILGVNSHIYIFRDGVSNLSDEDLSKIDKVLKSKNEVDCWSPIIMTQVMAAKSKRIKGSFVRGIPWQKEKLPTKYKKFVNKGSWKLENENDIVLGYKLARTLQATIGDTIQLISPINSKVTPMGVIPKKDNFIIVGLYESGMYEYDSSYLFMNLNAARKFADIGDEYNMLEISLKNEYIDKADYLAYQYFQELGNQYQVHSWMYFNGSLFSLLTLEKWVLFIILSFLILIASFNAISAISTSIIEKRKDIGILKTYGASNKVLQSIFVARTMITCIIAVIFGELLGLLLGKLITIQQFYQLKGEVYFIEKLSISIQSWDLSLIFLVSVVLIIISLLIPLRSISKMQITEILRS